MKDWKTKSLIAIIIIIVIIPLAAIRFKKGSSKEIILAEAVFIGNQQCLACHKTEHNLWQTSHHAKAMAHAADSTVLGDFNNAEFISKGDTHRFYKRNNKFFTYTKSIGGKMMEHEITHTFGYTPLQQYLIPFERGKFQCLPIAWDTEKKEWFNMGAMVYHDEEIMPDDWLYWTNQAQNWNGMCAECHSTNLKKNYIAEADSFHTTWSEINVSCEACHGPGSNHIAWSELPEIKQQQTENFGLLTKTSNISNSEYVSLCARCHARRSQIGDYEHGLKDLLDYMIPTLLHDDYFADGQILDEDYVWGSFVQSKMYHTDIKCNDCHDVHSGKRHFDGNTLCLQCHTPNYYNTEKHHFHKTEGANTDKYYADGKEIPVGEGAKCVNCHMPGRYYMGNDFRNDHSIRIPRPDLSKEIGVPNACNQCHTDKSVDWAITHTEKWFGKKSRPHYGTLIAKGREGDPEALKGIVELIRNELTPTIVRATVVELLANYTDSIVLPTIIFCLDNPESMIRLSAVKTYNSPDAAAYINNIGPLLTDPVKAVRMEAAIKLSYLPQNLIPESITASFKAAKQEFVQHNTYMADFPGGRGNLGLMSSNSGDPHEAIKHYTRAIEIDNQFYPAYTNLALAYNQVGNNQNAEKIYKYLLEEDAGISGINYSLGLLLAEQNKFEEAATYLEQATNEDPKNARINYNLGLIYLQLGQKIDAEKNLKKAIKTEPTNSNYEYALAHYYVSTEQINIARKYLLELVVKYPNNPDIIQLNNYVQNN